MLAQPRHALRAPAAAFQHHRAALRRSDPPRAIDRLLALILLHCQGLLPRSRKRFMTHDAYPSDGPDDSPQATTLVWQHRYSGVVEIARIGERKVAGISGPWSGKYALTWWDRPLPARQLELYDTLEEARTEVEAWALRMQYGLSPAPAAGPRQGAAPTPARASSGSERGLFGRIGALFRRRRRHLSSSELERLRRMHDELEQDLLNLHFGAYDEVQSRS